VIKTTDAENANLMIILSFILLGHPDWKNSDITIFDICKQDEVVEVKKQMNELIEKGRLPITSQKVKILVEEEGKPYKSIINTYSTNAGLTIIGFHEESIKHLDTITFEGYNDLGNVLFVNSFKNKLIE